MTLLANHILCLVPPASSALKQAMYLAERLKATLHVMSLPESQEATLDRDDLRSLIDRTTAKSEFDQPSFRIPDDAHSSLPEILRYVAEGNIDLVVTDMPPGDAAQSPLEVDPLRTLIEELESPIFIARHAKGPASIRRILVPTDLSDYALKAFQHAAALARLYNASVDVLHVLESIPYVALTQTDRLSLGPTPLSEHRGRRRLRAFLEEGQTPDVPVRSHLMYGDPASQIGRFAGEDTIDLLVLSSHGTGNRSQHPLGRVAESVLGLTADSLFLLYASGPSLLSTSPSFSSDTSLS